MSASYRYSLTNCLFNSAFHQVVDKCGCAPNLHDSVLSSQPACRGQQLECMKNFLDKIGQFRTIPHSDDRICMPACVDQTHSVERTSSAFPNKATFPRRQEQCLLILKLQSICETPKAETLFMKYPYLCSNASLHYQRCSQGQVDPYKMTGMDRASQTHLERLLFRYARENLVLVNIYIKVNLSDNS